MIRAVAARILRKILLVIVPCVVESSMEITALHQRCWQIGRLSVDAESIPAVDQTRGCIGTKRYSKGFLKQELFSLLVIGGSDLCLPLKEHSAEGPLGPE